jgi:hypothetical protein
MALPEAVIVVRFAGGVETKQDHKTVLPTKLLKLENAVFTRAISLVKRFGYESLGSSVLGGSTSLPTTLALGRRQYELVALSRDEVHSHVDDQDGWVRAGDMQSVIVDHEPIAKTGSDQTMGDMATHSGVAVYAWEDSRGGVWSAVYNDFTGRAIVAPVQLDAGGERPRVHAVGNYIHVYWVRTAAQEIRVRRIDPIMPTLAVDDILLTNISGTLPLYDVDQDESVAVIAWRNTDSRISVAYIHETGALGGAGLGLPTSVTIANDPAGALSIALDKTHEDRRIAVAWASAAKQYVMLDSDLVAEFAVRTFADPDAGGFCERMTCVFLRDDNDAGDRQLWVVSDDGGLLDIVRNILTDSNASVFTTHAIRIQRGEILGSKAFTDDEDAYVHTMHDTTLFRTYFTQRVSDGLCVGRFLPAIAGGAIPKGHLPSVSDELSPDGRAVRFAAIYSEQSGPPGSFTERGLRRVSIDFLSPDAYRSAQLGRTLYIGGGLLMAYDGEAVFEAGFHYGPDDIAPAVLGTPTVGPGQVDGTVGYRFCYERVMPNGELERGPTSATILVEITGGPRSVTFTLPTYGWQKPGVRIGCFRSEPGDSSAFRRVSSVDPTTAGQPNGYLANDPTANSVTFVDEMGEAALLFEEPLYTTGGIPSNGALGSPRLVASGQGRLFVVDSSVPDRVFFSQELDAGVAVEMAPTLAVGVDAFGGDINGFIVMDTAKVIFKETAILAFDGPGPPPNPDGQGGGFSTPRLVTSDVGCISPDSLVYTPVGVMFQSKKGIYQLGRDLSVSYVGADVEAFNDQTFVAATLIEDRTQIRFLTDAGVTLLYDYLFGAWSTFTNHEGRDAQVVDGVYHYVRNDGAVWRETLNEYRDDNSQIKFRGGTAWLHLVEHTQGFHRLWEFTVVGEWRSTHTLRVRAFYDYEDGYDDEWTFTPATFINLPGYGEGLYGVGDYGEGSGGEPSRRYQVSGHVGRQCEAVRFEWEFIEATGDFGAGGELTELILRGGVISNRYPLTDARRA